MIMIIIIFKSISYIDLSIFSLLIKLLFHIFA